MSYKEDGKYIIQRSSQAPRLDEKKLEKLKGECLICRGNLN